MTYTVHAYTVVRVKVVNVEAESQRDAIAQADDLVAEFAARAFRWHELREGPIDSYEWAEETVGYEVDEPDDPEYARSMSYRIECGELVDYRP